MSNKRLSRKRLFNIEKEGKGVAAGASSIMFNTIISATQHREGHKLVTDIVVDLAGSKQDLISGGDSSAANDIIGKGSDAAFICRLTDAVFGKVTSIETICLEAFVGSNGALAGSGSVQLVRGSGADGALNGTATGQAQVVPDIGTAIGKHTLTSFDNASTLANQYIYFAIGDHATNTTATATATITVGTAEDEAITIADVFTDEVSRITLTKANGQEEHQFFDLNGNDFDGVQASGKISIKTATTAAEIAEGITTAFNGGTSAFTAAQGSSPNLHVVTVTSTAAGVVGNQSNFFGDAPGKTAPITITDFTGGKTKGSNESITAGKFLLRFTGFVEPEDL